MNPDEIRLGHKKVKKKIPTRCPLASFEFPDGFNCNKDNTVVFDIDKIDCKCCFPAYMLDHLDSLCSCPEIRSDAPCYLDCNIFSEWYWRSKYKRRSKSNKRNPIDSRLRHEVFKRDGYKCKECGATNKEKVLHTDHIIPVSVGGTDELSNLQTLCCDCNGAKSDKKFIGGEGNCGT